ncbi:DNA-3-methyladenine glycosylase I, partial [Enterococcus faecalis]|uniref:DNA-3-methyladenine glycosylase I n=1 Tax=Enterococcus faecalis TaxID=1351 RepID=UPI0021E0A260
LKVQEEFGSFANYLWQFVTNVPVLSIDDEAYQVPRTQLLSYNVAKDLNKRGFSFGVPIVTNMFLKANGISQMEILNQE